MMKKFYTVRAKDGEGIILRDPTSPYVNGYSKFLYKTKVSQRGKDWREAEGEKDGTENN